MTTQTFRAVTLGETVGTRHWIWAFCLDCQNDRFLKPETIPLPACVPIPEIGAHLRCSACGSTKVHTKTSACWHDLDPGGMLAPSFREDWRLRRARGEVKGLAEP